MGTLFKGFQILCTDYDYVLGKRRDSIQGRTLYEGGNTLSLQSKSAPTDAC